MVPRHLSPAERTRLNTPGADNVTHLNNAGCALPVRSVVVAQREYLDAEAMTGGYEAAAAHVDVTERFYELLAKAVGANSDEIGFCQSATEAWRRVLLALPLPAGATIAFDESIYGGNLLALLDGSRRYGWKLAPIRVEPSGTMDEEVLEDVLRNRAVSLLALTHMPAQSGAVNDLGRSAAIARRHGVTMVVDACQTLGQVPLDVGREGVDAVVFTGRKYLRAPRGTGGYYVRRELAETLSPLVPDIQVADVRNARMEWDVRPGARLLEQWERNWTSVVGAVAALEYLAGLDASWVRARISGLAETLVAVLRSVPAVAVRRRSGETGGIVVFDVPGHDLVQIRDRLRARRVNVMFAGPQNAPIEMFARQERGWLRASVHYFNDESDLDALATELRAVLQEM